MLTLVKNGIKQVKKSRRTQLMAVFGIAMLVGFGIPYFGFGPSTTASAASNVAVTTGTAQQTATGATYIYKRLSPREAYPYYIAASFMVAAGLSLYAVTYVPSRAERRTRYVSRFETWSRTTY